MKYVGVDIGTTRTKAVVYDAERRRVTAEAARPTPVEHTGDGPVRDAAAVVRTVADAVAEAVRDLDGPPPAAVSLASLSEEIVLVGADGSPLLPVLTWYNPLGREYADHPAGPGADRLPAGADPSFSVFTLRWLAEHRPRQLKETERVTGLAGFVAGQLAGHRPGELTMDWSHASRTGWFDVPTGTWITPAVEWAGAHGGVLPRLVRPGAAVGALAADVSERCGLPAGIPVVSAGHDHFCGAYGCGIRQPGESFVSAGTSEAHLILTDTPPVPDPGGPRTDIGRFVDGELFYVHRNLPSGHLYQHWLRLLGLTDQDRLHELMAAGPPGSDGIRCLITPDGPPSADFLHVGIGTDRITLMRALSEGLAMASREVSRSLRAATGRRPTRSVAAGVPTRQPLWRELRAATTAGELLTVDQPESAALGAALLAQRALTGRADSPVRRHPVPAPEADKAAAYQRLIASYDRLLRSEAS
ncbi:FGGY-family carbohydrate kinase [Streptomyces hygroscopicus]|uniref:FGGY-family carbohydrate kinase n=1 Tax=Streptomyces hygroscopicus TaxID=1912 RepID=UPI0033CBA6A4